MAKQPPKSEPPPSSPRVAAPPSGGFMLVHRLLKLAALAVGLPATLLSGMALIGAYTESGYARAIGAALATLVVPLFIADRLLPAHDPARARGLVSDVCCVTWALAAFAFVGLAHGFSGPLLTREADRLVSAGYGEPARVAYLLAGVNAEAAPLPDPTSSGAASGSASAPLPAADAGPAPSATVDAGPAPDAGASRPKGAAADRTPAELFKEISPSVVSLTAFKSKTIEGGGTGFLIDRNGTIATNHHVIADASQVRVKFQGGAIFDAVELLIDDATVDLALIRIDLTAAVDGGGRSDVPALALGNSDDVVVGEHAVVIGNPLGLDHTLTDGLVSSRRVYDGKPWIQFSAPIGSGNSGGPLLNMRGEVIGVCTASLSGLDRGALVAQNLNLAVPVNDLKKVIRTEYPARRKLGDQSAPGRW